VKAAWRVRPLMRADTRRLVGFVAAQAVFVVGLVHLTLGLVNWLEWLQGGFLLPRDARWPVFVLSGGALIGGVYAATRTELPRRPLYAGGVVVLLGYAVGYFVWHITGHRPLLVLGGGADTEQFSLAWFLDHLFAGPLVFTAIVLEVAAAALLLLLLATETEAEASGDAGSAPAADGSSEPAQESRRSRNS
jgi:multisubunit Na+/H+ antiporter MnhC subunit